MGRKGTKYISDMLTFQYATWVLPSSSLQTEYSQSSYGQRKRARWLILAVTAVPCVAMIDLSSWMFLSDRSNQIEHISNIMSFTALLKIEQLCIIYSLVETIQNKLRD